LIWLLGLRCVRRNVVAFVVEDFCPACSIG
jgi:hypothetical protein